MSASTRKALSKPALIPSSVARMRIGKIIDRVSSSNEAVIITRYGKPIVVALGVDQYNSLLPKNKLRIPRSNVRLKRKKL